MSTPPAHVTASTWPGYATKELIGAGPLVDGRASALLIYKAEGEQGCREMIDNDPMQTEGVLKSYTVTEWNPATRAFDN